MWIAPSSRPLEAPKACWKSVPRSYFFYRAWRIAQSPAADKVKLHETAMLVPRHFNRIHMRLPFSSRHLLRLC